MHRPHRGCDDRNVFPEFDTQVRLAGTGGRDDISTSMRYANDSLLQKVRPHCACAALHDLCRRECPCCGCRSTWRRFSRRRSPYAEPAWTRVMCVTRGGQAGRGTGATGAMLSVGRQRAQTTAPSVQTAASTCAKPTWCARPSRRSLALPPKRRATGSVGVPPPRAVLHAHGPMADCGSWCCLARSSPRRNKRRCISPT